MQDYCCFLRIEVDGHQLKLNTQPIAHNTRNHPFTLHGGLEKRWKSTFDEQSDCSRSRLLQLLVQGSRSIALRDPPAESRAP